MKTAKCAVQTAVDNSQGAVYINLQGLCPDLVDDVLRIEVPELDVSLEWEPIKAQMVAIGFSSSEIYDCLDAFLLKARSIQLAKMLAERMS